MDPIKELSLKSVEAQITQINLENWDPNYDGSKTRDETREEINRFNKQISKLQYKFYADNSKSLLIILQGVDASGKDGTIRHLMKALNPQSCHIKSFKVPNDEEISHDYLWRIHKEIPIKGQIAIFNRSYYEDIIEPLVHNPISDNDLFQRYRQINDFERYLSENRIKILKFFLHISKTEQKKRLQNRLHDPTKYWKIEKSDLINHRNWNKYMEAYEKVLSLCNSRWAPWFIIPANQKHFRNWAISFIILETLKSMKLEFPSLRIEPSEAIFD